MIVLLLIALMLTSKVFGNEVHIGRVWPKAFYENKQKTTFTINIDKFLFKFQNAGSPKNPERCNIIWKAVKRCKLNIIVVANIAKQYSRVGDNDVRPLRASRHRKGNYNLLEQLLLVLKGPCNENEYPYFGMDESYNLTVSSMSFLRSFTVWGLLRGLETFSQLFYLTNDYRDIAIRATDIQDRPHYPHRGLLLDTARHFILESTILKLLDAMAMNKMNVFHWHIVDDESFPYQSERFPELSKKGSYFQTLVYDKSSIELIRDHARDLGIRVIPELDIPAHTASWSNSHKEIMCGKTLNPIKRTTYKLIGGLIAEMQGLFPDNYFHLGGDEINIKDWLNNAAVTTFMTKNNLTAPHFLGYFFMKCFSMLKGRTVPMMWEDVLYQGAPLPRRVVIEVWKEGYRMAEVLNLGYKAVLAHGFYLNYLDNTIEDIYDNEPRMNVGRYFKILNISSNVTLLENLLGGEACVWTEKISDTNLLTRVWPLASAVAEVLWSVTNRNFTPEAESRIDEQTCRMVRRGIPAQPADGLDFCVL